MNNVEYLQRSCLAFKINIAGYVALVYYVEYEKTSKVDSKG